MHAFRTPVGRLVAAARFRTFGSWRASLFELDRPQGSLAPSRAAYPDGYAFREAGIAEAAECARVTRLPEREVRRRLAAGDACYVVARGPRVATVIWVHDGRCYVLGLGYVVERLPGERYVYGIVTDPIERGKGLYRNALEDLSATLFASGASRLLQVVEAGNVPVLTTLPRLGYRRTQEIASLLLLGVRRTVVTPLAGGRVERAWRVSPPRDRFLI